MESPFIAHAILIGDKRSTVSAILSPDFKVIRDWAKKNSQDVAPLDNGALARHPDVERLLKGEIERLLPDLADFEKIRKFTVVGEEFTIDNGALTPTLKVKKRVLLDRYKDEIEEMYR